MKAYYWLRFVALFIVVTLLVAACGGGGAAPAVSAPTEAPQEEPAAEVKEEPVEAAAEPTEAVSEAEPTEAASEEEPAEADTGEENVLTIGIPGDIETLDPSFGAAEMANTVLKNIYDQPVRYVRKETADGYMIADVTQLEGAVWESFELQPDGVTYKIKVRPGMKFHETGNEITAETGFVA